MINNTKEYSYTITALEQILLRIRDNCPRTIDEIISIIKSYENEMNDYIAVKDSPPKCFIVAKDVAIGLQNELRYYSNGNKNYY